MPKFKTTCARDCYDGCGMIVETDNNLKIISVKGDNEHPITKGFLCPRGAKDIDRLYKNRVEEPVFQTENSRTVVDWQIAIEQVAKKLKNTIDKYGKESVLYLDYAGNEGLISNVFAKRLWNYLNVTQTDGALCTASGHYALNLHYGNSYGVLPQELPEKKLIVFWGFNPIVTAPHIWRLALDARKNNNAKIVVIDPINTASAKKADLHIQVKPSTDTVLAYFIVNQIIKSGKHDLDFIHDYTFGFEKLKEKASESSIEKTSEITGILENKLQELSQFYSRTKLSATVIGVAVQKTENGIEPVRAISLIPAVLGIKRGFFYSNSRGLTVDTDKISGEFLSTDKKIVSQVNLSELVYNGKFKFIFVNSMNPVKTLPNPEKFVDGIKKNNVYLVVNETHWSETAKLANIVLPVPAFLEKDDVMLSWGHNFTRYSEKCSDRITNSLTEDEIIRKVAEKLNITHAEIFKNPKDVLSEVFDNQSLNDEKIFSGNLLELKFKDVQKYDTPSGKIEFYSSKAEKLGLNPLPELIGNFSDDFTLITSAVAKYTNTQFKEVFGDFKPEVFINPEDALMLNLTESDEVELENSYAKRIFNVKISTDIPRKTVWAQRQIDDLNGNSINDLTPPIAQKFGNGPIFNSTKVKASKQ